MRDIAKVIDAIKSVIPPNYIEVKERLDAIAAKTAYVPPECQQSFWDELSTYLSTNLGHPDVKWKQNVADIMQGKGCL